MIPSSLYLKVYIWSYDHKYYKFSIIFFKFQQLQCQISQIDKKLIITCFAIKLFIYTCSTARGFFFPQWEYSRNILEKIFMHITCLLVCMFRVLSLMFAQTWAVLAMFFYNKVFLVCARPLFEEIWVYKFILKFSVSVLFQIIPEYSRVFPNIPKSSRTFQNIQNIIFHAVQIFPSLVFRIYMLCCAVYYDVINDTLRISQFHNSKKKEGKDIKLKL